MSSRTGVAIVAVVALGALGAAWWWLRAPASPQRAAGRGADAGASSSVAGGDAPDGMVATPSGRPPAGSDAGADQGSEGVLDSDEACEVVCGAPCDRDAAGARTCPPRCQADEDCASDRACLVTRMDASGRRTFRCLASECEPGERSARPCPEGESCVSIGGGARTSWRCRPQGERRAGEACADLDYAAIGQCAPGLRCLSGSCLPTSCAQPGDCPAGSVCMASAAGGKACAPWCGADADCGPDRRCVRTPLGSLCVAASAARTCLEDGCGAGEACVPEHLVPWNLVARCSRTCTPGEPGGCPGGQVCASEVGIGRVVAEHRCLPACQRDADCAAGYVCVGGAEGARVCLYSTTAATDRVFSERFGGR